MLFATEKAAWISDSWNGVMMRRGFGFVEFTHLGFIGKIALYKFCSCDFLILGDECLDFVLLA